MLDHDDDDDDDDESSIKLIQCQETMQLISIIFASDLSHQFAIQNRLL